MTNTTSPKLRDAEQSGAIAMAQAPGRTAVDSPSGEAMVRERAREIAKELKYSTGFANEHASEALPDALPIGHSYPQRAPYGLYIELFSDTAFPEPRVNTRRTWLYRSRPSVASPRFERIDNGTLLTPPFTEVPIDPNVLYWDPRPAPPAGTDFVSGLWTLGGNGGPDQRDGIAVHLYTADTSMTDRVFSTSDGEMLIAPSLGDLLIHTEFGMLSVKRGEIALIPRSCKFRVEIQNVGKEGFVRGYVYENFGRPFILPELGFTGQNGMANPRDFRAPTAAYDHDHDRPVEVINKIGGNLWRAAYDYSPLNVVAWHGNCVPYVYNLRQFQLMGSVSFDHADPSRYTVLHSPTAFPGAGNFDFCVAGPESDASENTLHTSYFHRQISPELITVISGAPEFGEAFQEGICVLTNTMIPHGPSAEAYTAAYNAEHSHSGKKIDKLFVIGEARLPIRLTSQAYSTMGTTDEQLFSGNNTLKRSSGLPD